MTPNSTHMVGRNDTRRLHRARAGAARTASAPGPAPPARRPRRRQDVRAGRAAGDEASRAHRRSDGSTVTAPIDGVLIAYPSEVEWTQASHNVRRCPTPRPASNAGQEADTLCRSWLANRQDEPLRRRREPWLGTACRSRTNVDASGVRNPKAVRSSPTLPYRAERRRRTCTKAIPPQCSPRPLRHPPDTTPSRPGLGKAPPGSSTTPRDCYHCYWLVGPADDHLVEHTNAPSAAVAVEWARSRTPRARIRLPDHHTYWGGPDPAPGGFPGAWTAAGPTTTPPAGHLSPETPPHRAVAETA